MSDATEPLPLPGMELPLAAAHQVTADEVPASFSLYSREYRDLHRLIRRMRGQASRQQCVECGGTAADWARLHDQDGSDVWHYVSMCRKCHSAYDSGGRPMSDESRKKLSQYSRNRDPQHQRKLSESLKGRAATSGMTGKTHSAETRRRMSESRLGKNRGPMPLETRQRISDAMRGRPRPPEVVAKVLATKARLAVEKRERTA
jgi:NUMOD3 motif